MSGLDHLFVITGVETPEGTDDSSEASFLFLYKYPLQKSERKRKYSKSFTQYLQNCS